jgi:hypothetical protein
MTLSSGMSAATELSIGVPGQASFLCESLRVLLHLNVCRVKRAHVAHVGTLKNAIQCGFFGL